MQLHRKQVVLRENNAHALRAFRCAQRTFLYGKTVLVGPHTTHPDISIEMHVDSSNSKSGWQQSTPLTSHT